MNDFKFTGTIVTDPRQVTTRNDSFCVRCRFAINEVFVKTTTSEKDFHANFIPVEIWGDIGKSFMEMLKKGDEVLVQGQVRSRDHSKEAVREFAEKAITIKNVDELEEAATGLVRTQQQLFIRVQRFDKLAPRTPTTNTVDE